MQMLRRHCRHLRLITMVQVVGHNLLKHFNHWDEFPAQITVFSINVDVGQACTQAIVIVIVCSCAYCKSITLVVSLAAN